MCLQGADYAAKELQKAYQQTPAQSAKVILQQKVSPSWHFYNALIESHNLTPSKTIMVGNDWIADARGAADYGIDSIYTYKAIFKNHRFSTSKLQANQRY